MSLQGNISQKKPLEDPMLVHTAFLLVLRRVVRFKTAFSSVDFPAFARPVLGSMIDTHGFQEGAR